MIDAHGYESLRFQRNFRGESIRGARRLGRRCTSRGLRLSVRVARCRLLLLSLRGLILRGMAAGPTNETNETNAGVYARRPSWWPGRLQISFWRP